MHTGFGLVAEPPGLRPGRGGKQLPGLECTGARQLPGYWEWWKGLVVQAMNIDEMMRSGIQLSC